MAGWFRPTDVLAFPPSSYRFIFWVSHRALNHQMAKIQVARVSRLAEPHQDEREDKQEGQKMNHFPCGKVSWAPATAATVPEGPLEEEALLEPESWGSVTSGPAQQPACPVAKSSLTVRKATGAVFPLSTGRPCGLSCIQDPRTQESDLQRKSSICYCALGNGFAHSLGWFLMGSILLFQSSLQKAD